MPRSLPEWIGKTPDAQIPPRVRLRVFDHDGGRCRSCRRKIVSGEGWICDHVVALINGGANRESNLQPLCEWCANIKDWSDVAEKAKVVARRKRHLGIKRKRASFQTNRDAPFKKRMDGTVVKRTFAE